MKGIVVTTDLEIRIEEFSDPLYKTVGSAVGGYIEHVKPARLRHPYCMIVNEEGRLLDLPLNYVGSYFYGTDEPDIVGLNDIEAEQIKDVIIDLIEPLHQQPKGEST